MPAVELLVPWVTGALELAGIAAILLGAVAASSFTLEVEIAGRWPWYTPLSAPVAETTVR
jgi:hypothetical protein